MPETVDWVPGLLVLAAGLLGGYVLVRRLTSTAGAASDPSPAPPALRDLEARRDALVDQLRELDDAASARGERARLEREAALVLRDLDRLAPAGAPATVAAEAPRRAAFKGFLWGTGSAAAVALLVFLVSRSATERDEGGSLTGEVPGGAGAPSADDEMSLLQAAVERNPDDLEARLTLARAALTRQDMMVVYDQTRAVLEKRPGDPRALSYQALVRLAMGQADMAEKMLREALQSEPDLLEGYIHLSLVHLRQGRVDEAESDIEEAARRSPEHAPRLRAIWAEMRSQAEPAPEAATPAGEDPHADLPEPGARPAGAPGAVRGTVELASGLQPAPGAIVFVSVRPAGTAEGPPLAAKRLSAASFPLAFEVGPGDSMMGQTLPDRVRVDVRVDGDGDPMTRDPGDPSASADDVRLGAAPLRLVLRKGP
ncbi:MAG TPA: tetratricopeptide repeat protein [Vicinamibacteria bacterium]|nr:tetratricopeptide repeat protein [Vicinamibacteria bacterium]